MDDERRVSTRYQVKVEVGMQTESNFYTGLTQDVSGGGIFVATHMLRSVGEHIRVLLNLPGQSETFDHPGCRRPGHGPAFPADDA